MPSFKQILIEFLAEFKRSNDIRERQVSLAERAGYQGQNAKVGSVSSGSAGPRVIDKVRTDVRKAFNANIRVSPAEGMRVPTKPFISPGGFTAPSVDEIKGVGVHLVEKLKEAQERHGIDPRAKGEGHRTDRGVYPTHIPVPAVGGVDVTAEFNEAVRRSDLTFEPHRNTPED